MPRGNQKSANKTAKKNKVIFVLLFLETVLRKIIFQRMTLYNASKKEECPVCLDYIYIVDRETKSLTPKGTLVKSSSCPHLMHKECLENWLTYNPKEVALGRCPVCRADILTVLDVTDPARSAEFGLGNLLNHQFTHI